MSTNHTAGLQTTPIEILKRAALLAGLCAFVVLVGAVGTARADAPPAEILVTTEADSILVEADPADLLQACVANLGALNQSGTGGTVAQQLETAQNTVNEADGDPDTKEVPPIGVRGCSIRMALETARLFSLPTSQNLRSGNTFFFSRPVIKFADGVVDVEVNGVNGLLPLPPITSGGLTIDGCSDNKTDGAPDDNNTGPCVNILLPDLSVLGIVGILDLPAVVPQSDALTGGLFVAADGVTIEELAFQGFGPAIYTLLPVLPGQVLDGLQVRENHFGLDVDGSEENGGPLIGIVLSGNNSVIGGPIDPNQADDARNFRGNVFSGHNDIDGSVGILVAGARNTKIQGNRFGVKPDGKATGNALGTGVKLVGLGLDGAGLADTSGTLIGGQLSVVTEKVGDKFEVIEEKSSARTPQCDGPCNLFGNVSAEGDFAPGAAIDIGDRTLLSQDLNDLLFDLLSVINGDQGELPAVSNTTIQGNQIGVVVKTESVPPAEAGGTPTTKTTETPAGSEIGILIRNKAYGTTIGGTNGQRDGNTISHSKGPGVAVHTDAGDNTQVIGNVGRDNVANLLIDLGDFQNPGFGVGSLPSGGIKEPWITEATATLTTTTSGSSSTQEFTGATVRGTAAAGARIHVYAVTEVQDDGRRTHGDLERYVGQATADGAGNWTASNLSIPSADVQKNGARLVTATATGDKGTSELALNFEVRTVATRTVVIEPTVPVELPTPPAALPPGSQTGPALSRVFNRRPSRRSVIFSKVPGSFSGVLTDPNGVSRVDVSVRVVGKERKRRVVEGSATRTVTTCSFLYLKRARAKYVRRRCARPPFTKASGTTRWKYRLDSRAKRRIKAGRRYQLYVRAWDTLGNRRTHKINFKVRRKRVRRSSVSRAARQRCAKRSSTRSRQRCLQRASR